MDGVAEEDFISEPEAGHVGSPLRIAFGVAGVALVALDVALVLAGRRNGRNGRETTGT
jgi:hypothetical protein